MAKIAVAPLVGAWIEIAQDRPPLAANLVAPLVGAWIEINSNVGFSSIAVSLPSWERGLKSEGVAEGDPQARRSPRGSVD